MNQSIKTTALMMTGYGELETNLIIQERVLSPVKDSEVLIRVEAAAVNPIDYKIVSGLLKKMEKLHFPSPMGFDGSGIIVGVGNIVSKFKPGDEVYVRTGRFNKGSIAKHMLAHETQLSLKPKNLNFQEAASLPLVALTTMQHLSEYADAKPTQHVFINAGAGGIGTFAIQYAKAINLEVTVQCNSKDEAFLKPLGPDHFIFYDQENYMDRGPIFDIVYDCLGNEHTIQSFAVVKKGGTVVSIAGPPDQDFARRENLGFGAKVFLWSMNRKVYAAAKKAAAKYYRALTRADGSQLDDLRAMVEKGEIRAIIDRVFPFEKSVEALAYVKKGKSKGKVVIAIG